MAALSRVTPFRATDNTALATDNTWPDPDNTSTPSDNTL